MTIYRNIQFYCILPQNRTYTKHEIRHYKHLIFVTLAHVIHIAYSMYIKHESDISTQFVKHHVLHTQCISFRYRKNTIKAPKNTD